MDRKFALLVGISAAAHGAAFWLTPSDATQPTVDLEQGRMSVAVRYVAPSAPPRPKAEFKPVDPPVEPMPMDVEPTPVAEPVPAPAPTQTQPDATRPRPVQVAAAALPDLPPPTPAAPTSQPPRAEPTPMDTPQTQSPQAQPARQVSRPSQGVQTAQHAVSFPKNKPPKYPEIAVRNNWEGTVELEVSIGADGKVSEAKIVSSSRHRKLDTEAVESLKKWLFQPATREGRPVASRVGFTVVFRLEGQSVQIR